MIKNLRYLLLSLSVMLCGSLFAQDEKNATWTGAESPALPTEIGNDISLTWIEGSGDQGPSFNSTKNAISIKKGNKLTITGADANVTVSKIVFMFDTSTYPGFSVNVGSNANNYGDNSTTWTGESNSITFTANGAKLVKSIAVTYTGAAAPVVKAPALAITDAGVADTYDMDTNPVFVAYYKNEGTAAATNAKLTVYVDNTENFVKEIGEIAINGNGFVNCKYDLTNLEAGNHQVYVSLTADNAEEVKTEAKAVAFTKKAPVATYSVTAENTAIDVEYDAQNFEIKATVKNTNSVAADSIVVYLTKGITAVDSIIYKPMAADAEKVATFTVTEKGEAGTTATYYVKVGTAWSEAITVTFKEAPVVDVKDLAITGIQGTIDQALESNTITVLVENKGNVVIDAATITLKAGETILGTGQLFGAVQVKDKDNEGTGFSTIAISKEIVDALTAGNLEVTATAVVEGENTDKLDNNTFVKTIEVKAIPAPVAEYIVTAEKTAIDVEYDAQSFEIKATVKNTNSVAADSIVVYLTKGITAVDSVIYKPMAADAEKVVTFTVNEIGEAGKTAKYWVRVGNIAQTEEITVTFKEAPVVDVKDLAITGIQGTIDQALESNTITVLVENKGNVVIDAATITLKAGETILGTGQLFGAVQVKDKDNEGTGFSTIAISKEIVDALTAGNLEVTATAVVEGEDTDKLENNTVEATIEVKTVPAPVAEYSIEAANVEVEFGAASYSIVAKVKNTNNVASENVKVRLMDGINTVDSTYIQTLAADAETEVTFTINATEENPFVAGTQKNFFVQVANKAQTEVNVTFKEQPVVEVKDLAITSLNGTLYTNIETNYLTVYVENKGTVDITNAPVIIIIGEKQYNGTISAKAGEENNTGFCSIAVPGADLTEGEVTVNVTVTVEGDANADDNVLNKAMTVSKDTTDSISVIKAMINKNARIFDLNGKKVNSVKKGSVYVINGKKVVVK